jgi:exodeoxyribonuclease VII small subunit
MANFEEHLTQLETVVERLERGDLTLDESVRLFENGMKLSDACKQELEQAEGRVQLLVQGAEGKMQAVEMESDELRSDASEADEGEDEE